MKTIMIGEEREITGKIMHASAHDYIEQKIYGYLLTEDEAAETCYFGGGECQCSTCKGDDCPYFEERIDGNEPVRKTETPCDYGECPYDAEYGDDCRRYCGLGVDE